MSLSHEGRDLEESQLAEVQLGKDRGDILAVVSVLRNWQACDKMVLSLKFSLS